MKLEFEFNDIARSGVKKKFVRKAAEAALRLSGYDLSRKEISVSFAMINANEMRKSNKTYRHIDAPTDVLSFPEYENKEALMDAGDKLFLGEAVLCYNYIKEFSANSRLNLKQELARTVSHAILHLLGFRHGKKMFQIQDTAAKNLSCRG